MKKEIVLCNMEIIFYKYWTQIGLSNSNYLDIRTKYNIL